MPYATYPNVKKNIEKTIKRLELTVLKDPPEAFIEKRLRFYYTQCKTKTGEKVFFKSVLKKELAIKNRFLNEINFLKTLKENPKHSLSKSAPKILTYSLNPSFPYLLYKFLPGKTKTRQDTFSAAEIKKIGQMMKDLNSTENIFNFAPKKSVFNFPAYKKRNLALLKKVKLESRLQEKIKKIIENSKETFSLASPKLCHGDFSEANTVFYQGKIKLIDWEHVHLRNPMYDFTSFWVKRKKRPKEQKALEQSYLGKTQPPFFSLLFKLALIELSLGDLLFFHAMIKDIQESNKPQETKQNVVTARRQEIADSLSLLRAQI